MSRLPRAVEKQAELADQAYQQAYGTPDGTTPPAPAPTVKPAPADTTPPQPTEPVSSAPAEDPAKTSQPPADKPADESGDLDHWKQRAKVAEGRLAKEMPRMAQTIRDLRDQLASAEQKVASLESTPVATNDGIKPEEVEQYGAEFIDMVKRAAKSATGVDGDVKKQLEQVTEAQRKVARQAFFASLNQDAPQWEQLNTDQDFLNYLAGLDPYTGRPRQELFDDAYEKLDAWRIANFFNSFAQSRQPSAESRPPSRADQVVPSSTRTASPPSPTKRMWTTEGIARFYDDIRRGKVTEAEAARIESDIFAAQSEGRLR